MTPSAGYKSAAPGRFMRVVGASVLVLLLVGCDRAGSGKPSRPTGAPSASRVAGPSGRPSGAVPTGGVANSPLCRDFRAAGGRITDVRHADRYGATLWEKLAADAPAAIRPDAELVARFANAVAAGRPAPSGVAQAVGALGRVSDWATKNCI